MSLIGFHRFLIASAIVFCALFAAWEFRRFTVDGGFPALALGITFAVLAAALGYYLANLARFLDREPTR